MSLPSPYAQSVNRGLVEQVISILQMNPEESEALVFLLGELKTMEHDETINDIFDFVLAKYKSVSYRRLYQAYEAIYQIHSAKLALETSLKDGQSASIKKALEDLADFASQIPPQQQDETLTADQEVKLQQYLSMLESYYEMYTNEEGNNPTDPVD